MDETRAVTDHTGIRLAEARRFLPVVIVGILLAAAQIPRFRFGTARMIVAGRGLAAGGVLVVVATHRGHFG